MTGSRTQAFPKTVKHPRENIEFVAYQIQFLAELKMQPFFPEPRSRYSRLLEAGREKQGL